MCCSHKALRGQLYNALRGQLYKALRGQLYKAFCGFLMLSYHLLLVFVLDPFLRTSILIIFNYLIT